MPDAIVWYVKVERIWATTGSWCVIVVVSCYFQSQNELWPPKRVAKLLNVLTTINNRWDNCITFSVAGNTTLTPSCPNVPSALTLLWPEGIFCRLTCTNRPPLPITSTDPLLWRERATLHLNLTRLMENAGPWKAAFSGYMSPLGVDQPYANWHGWGWMANVDCNSGPWTKSPPWPPTPPPELNRRSGCLWHKARSPPYTLIPTRSIGPPPVWCLCFCHDVKNAGIEPNSVLYIFNKVLQTRTCHACCIGLYNNNT